MVHLEVPVAKVTFHDYDPKLDKRQFIDIVVSDLTGFVPERDVFAERPHDLFIEVKYVGHGGNTWRFVGQRTISHFVKSDLEKLKRNVELGRCRAAVLLLVDDNSYLEGTAGEGLLWSPKVRPLVASPIQLARREHAREMGVALPEWCANCGSPHVAAVLWGMPLPEIEEAVSKREIISAGCEPFGEGLDPTFGCLDCGTGDGHPDPIREYRASVARQSG